MGLCRKVDAFLNPSSKYDLDGRMGRHFRSSSKCVMLCFARS